MQDEFQRIQSTLQRSIAFVTHESLEALRIAGRIMINPAHDYVAEFTNHVPLTRVCCARNAMDNVAALSSEMSAVQVNDYVEDSVAELAICPVGALAADCGRPIGAITAHSLVGALSGGEAEGLGRIAKQEASH